MPPKNGEDVPLPPVDETPLELPAELFGEEVRERQENGGTPQATATPPVPYIVFDHVSKSFGDLHVLDDVSFEVLTGETLCILGRSGVGKSVSLQQIMGFLKPEKGRILVAGEDITGFSDEQMGPVRKKVTMVFQSGALFDSLSVGENVAFPLRERKELEEDQIQKIVTGLLEMVGVTGMTDLLPSDLSTGMKRSVAIARAMAAQPEAILYDEPTTMVDPLIGAAAGRPDPEAEDAAAADQRRGDARHALCREACGPCRVPASGEGPVLWDDGRDEAKQRRNSAAVSGAGCARSAGCLTLVLAQ